MLAHATPSKPAPFLGARGIGLRLRVGPNAFGNALGSSLADQIGQGSQQYSELEQAQDLAREMNRGSWTEARAASVSLGSGLRVTAEQAAAWGPRFASENDYAFQKPNYALLDEGQQVRLPLTIGSGPTGDQMAAMGAAMGSGYGRNGNEFMPVAGSVVKETLVSISRRASTLDNPYGLGVPSTPEEAAMLIRSQVLNGELGAFVPRTAPTAADLREIAKYQGPSFRAWDGVSRDPYASGRRNLGMALAGTTVAAAVVIPATATSMTAAGAVYSTVGPWGTAGIGFVTAGGMDAGMQYYDSGTVRPVQSMFSGAVGAISGPVGATSRLWTNIVLGGTGAAINTGFQNLYYGDDKSLVVPTLVGSAFGAGGYYAGMATTKGLSYFKPEIYYPNLNPQMPALFQPRAINIVPGAVGVSVGGIASGTAPMGESLINSLSSPPPKR